MTVPMCDTPQSFGAISVALHWIVAALVSLLLITALMMAIWLPDRMAQPLATPFGVLDRTTLVLTHEAFGLLLVPFAIARTIWRLRSGKPVPPAQHKSLMLLASIIWRGLLVGILIQLITGPLALFFYGYPLQFFSLDVVPSPFSESKFGHDLSETVHNLVGWTICGMLVLHAAGALYHALLERDGTLRRMIFPGRTLREYSDHSGPDWSISPLQGAEPTRGGEA